MDHLATFMVRCVDLIEAEGRSLRASTLKVGLTVTLMIVSATLAVAGVGLALWAMYMWIAAMLGPAAGVAIVAMVILILAGALAWSAHKLAD